MQARRRLLTGAILLGLGKSACAGAAALTSAHLLDQAESMPADFREHFFDVPLVVRVERDGQYLGHAKIVLSPRNTVQLLQFVDTHESTSSADERERWAEYLNMPRPLGRCEHACGDLVALHYSLESSVLALVTSAAERDVRARRYHSLPVQGSYGAILTNSINLNTDGSATAGSYLADMKASVGQWTLAGNYQAYRSGERRAPWRQSLQGAYAEHEQADRFVRLGYFLPYFQGVTRQPNAPGLPVFTTVGAMVGSSDTLTADDGSASLVPLYVTANRQGSVELYRNGALIYTQQVEPGLQVIDTRRLPGGIYEVEVRTIEDGRVTSTRNELINKPAHWRNLDKRWRYSAYAGQQRSLLDERKDIRSGAYSFGGIVNYLAHPRAVLGASLTGLGGERNLAGSVDWHAHERANFYANAYHSNRHGNGIDLQALYSYRQGSLTVNHGRSWQTDDLRQGARPGWVRTTAAAATHRFDDRSTLTARASHSRGASQGLGFDLMFSRRQTWAGSQFNWRASVFDRPASFHGKNQRNRGFDLALTFSLGNDDRNYQGNVGSRTGVNGRRDLYGSLGVQQRVDTGPIRFVSADVTADRYGFSLGANTQFDSRLLSGNAFAQRSSFNGKISGGLALENTIAFGGGSFASSGRASQVDTGLILDIDSDIPDLALRADDSRGASTALKPGRNLIPVTAYKSGIVRIDFTGHDMPPAAIYPLHIDYHLNKGGIAQRSIKITRTVTVIGRVADEHGAPLRGAQLHNHVGRSVTEADGFFTLEMSASQPEVEVRHASIKNCRVKLDASRYPRDGDTILAGTLTCPSLPSHALIGAR
ncbi:MAG TPA: TcfC E-set like domain-containing protein [Dyella sp.]|uniref:TcfC E-set like domain-containing protein n=1 Tax=Dyella sp. TaxID=1869338 RepID=UPI002F95E834